MNTPSLHFLQNILKSWLAIALQNHFSVAEPIDVLYDLVDDPLVACSLLLANVRKLHFELIIFRYHRRRLIIIVTFLPE